jgi:hypothetical protein
MYGGRILEKVNFDDLSRWAYERVNVITLKRFEQLEPDLKKVVTKEAQKLFKIMTGALPGTQAIDVDQNPFWHYGGAWPELTKHYAKEKLRALEYNTFWYYRNTCFSGLKNWLNETDPTTVYGKPVIYLKDINNFARGRQKAAVYVNVFPWTKPRINRWIIYNKLYGRPTTNGSNEQMRPIIGPSMANLINFRIKQRVTRTIRRVMENGHA